MSILNFLQLQPVEPTDDNTVSPLDEYQHDETIDLSADIDGAVLVQELEAVINDFKEDPEKLTFSEK